MSWVQNPARVPTQGSVSGFHLECFHSDLVFTHVGQAEKGTPPVRVSGTSVPVQDGLAPDGVRVQERTAAAPRPTPAGRGGHRKGRRASRAAEEEGDEW